MPETFTATGLGFGPLSVPGYAFRSQTVITATGASTYTTPTDVNLLVVLCIAGGGAGGGAATGSSQGGAGTGGQGGHYVLALVQVPRPSYPVNVGAGGTAGSAGNVAGNNGGNTTFDTTNILIRATGGSGGNGMAAGSTELTRAAVQSTTPQVGGLISGRAQVGGWSWRSSDTILASGGGGSSLMGGGGAGRVSHGNGLAGGLYGGGGGGGCCVSGGGNVAGGAGGQGVLIIWEYV